MHPEHRRMLAAAIGRLRAKIRYRPVVFELMQAEFTLFDLQKTVEAVLGPNLHKQNFRRLVESVGLVEPTGEIRTHTGGGQRDFIASGARFCSSGRRPACASRQSRAGEGDCRPAVRLTWPQFGSN